MLSARITRKGPLTFTRQITPVKLGDQRPSSIRDQPGADPDRLMAASNPISCCQLSIAGAALPSWPADRDGLSLTRDRPCRAPANCRVHPPAESEDVIHLQGRRRERMARQSILPRATRY